MEVLAGGCSVSDVCNRHQISQAQFYSWKDKLMHDGAKLFARGGVDKAEERLKQENQKLKGIIGDLTVELKKNDF